MAGRRYGSRDMQYSGFAREFYAASADRAEDDRVPLVRLPSKTNEHGERNDIPRERRFRNVWKNKRLSDRRKSRKARGKV